MRWQKEAHTSSRPSIHSSIHPSSWARRRFLTVQRHLKRPLSIGPDKVSTTLTLATLVQLRAGQTCLRPNRGAPELISHHPAFVPAVSSFTEEESSWRQACLGPHFFGPPCLISAHVCSLALSNVAAVIAPCKVARSPPGPVFALERPARPSVCNSQVAETFISRSPLPSCHLGHIPKCR